MFYHCFLALQMETYAAASSRRGLTRDPSAQAGSFKACFLPSWSDRLPHGSTGDQSLCLSLIAEVRDSISGGLASTIVAGPYNQVKILIVGFNVNQVGRV
jgi:hypothetical protein